MNTRKAYHSIGRLRKYIKTSTLRNTAIRIILRILKAEKVAAPSAAFDGETAILIQTSLDQSGEANPNVCRLLVKRRVTEPKTLMLMGFVARQHFDAVVNSVYHMAAWHGEPNFEVPF